MTGGATGRVRREAGRAGREVGREARRAGHEAGRRTRRANRRIEKAAANPWLERAARLGYVVRGLLYGAMGGLALSVALGGHARTTDQRGEILLLAGSPFAAALLAVVVVGLAAYALWGFVRAAYDPLGRGGGVTGIAARLGFAWSGVNYAALSVFAMGFLAGTAKGGESDSVRGLVNRALSQPAGAALVTAAGAIGVLAGLGQLVEAWRAGFSKDLTRNRMSRAERVAADVLGRFGFVARAVIFTMLGVFVLQAGLHDDDSQARGMGPAFQALAGEPMGHLILGVVALGFVALGLHSILSARRVRMPQPG
ncbi:MAG TPA: DUF1206 domain-containing protein [Candidatus Dormibacteraeota bacterium]|nr:DUF1206 domain-containing protein [Candidatus Dormibacteraeota bacterium]